MSRFIHELAGWPMLAWDHERLASPLAAVRHRQGRLIGHMEALGFTLQQEAVLQTLTADVLKSSEIEGERLDADAGPFVDRPAARHGHRRPEARRPPRRRRRRDDARCHAALRPAADARTAFRLARLAVPDGPKRHASDHGRAVAGRQHAADAGRVRTGRKERVHFEAPGSRTARARDAAVPGVVQRRHDDRSGTEGRAGPPLVRDHPPVRRRQRPHRPRHRRHGPRALGATVRSGSTACPRRSGDERGATTTSSSGRRRGTMDITPWMDWFLGCLARAIDGAQTTLGTVLAKARFWETLRDVAAQRPPAARDQPAARRLRGQAHNLEVGAARQDARRTPRCATSCRSSTAASWYATPKAGAAPATHFPAPRACPRRPVVNTSATRSAKGSTPVAFDTLAAAAIGEAEIRERQQRDGAARRTAAVTDDSCRLASELDALDRPAQRIRRRRAGHEARGRLEGVDCLRPQQARLQHRRPESHEVGRRREKRATARDAGVVGCDARPRARRRRGPRSPRRRCASMPRGSNTSRAMKRGNGSPAAPSTTALTRTQPQME